MQREGTLHANAVGNTAEGEGLTDAAVALRDADALEGLQALAIALNNLNHDTQGIAHVELGKVFLELLALNCTDDFAHRSVSPFVRRSCVTRLCSQRSARSYKRDYNTAHPRFAREILLLCRKI